MREMISYGLGKLDYQLITARRFLLRTDLVSTELIYYTIPKIKAK
jgi:hypothetical protein